LGVVDLGDFRTFVVADIPGLIEGAHEGAGLGDRFLRHIERTTLLLHLVDVSSSSGRETVDDYRTVNHELAAYNPTLATRPQIVVATKIDALDDPGRLESLKQAASDDGHEFYAISAVTNQNVRELVNSVAAKLEGFKRAAQENAVVELALS
jgi:GTPase